MKRCFLTPNEPVDTGSFHILLTLPKSVEFRQLIKGALMELALPENWQQFGNMSPERSAEFFADVLSTIQDMPMNDIGTFVYSIRESVPANWIPCTGGDLAMADWPELMDVYPSVLKNQPSAGRFIVPDLRGRTLIGNGVDTSGFNWQFLSIGGSRQVTLTLNQIPSHQHTEITSVSSVVNGGLEAPTVVGVPGTGVTGAAGAGAAHDNMPPYGVCRIYLVGRLLP